MRRRAHIAAAALAATAMLSTTAPAAGAPEPDCQNDSKSLGRIELSTANTPGTWWYITRTGFDAAGISDYKAAIDAFFGMSSPSLEAAVQVLVNAVEVVDKNGNGFVCASSIRGTRSFIGDPNYAYYFFLASDDKHEA